MKNLRIIIIAIIAILSLQSCSDKFFLKKNSKQFGYVTDTLGVGIADVKITVIEANDFSSSGKDTEHVFYTNNEGYYELEFEWQEGNVYRMKAEHDNYIYVLISGTAYPQIPNGAETEKITTKILKI